MRASFTNTSAGEYEQPDGAAAGSPQVRRCIYASWHPDEVQLAIFWVKRFKERIEARDFISLVQDKVEKAGTPVAVRRDQIQERLKDVTDFVVVWSAAYFRQQKQLCDESELSWMIQSTPEQARRAIWVAALERSFGFRRLQLGDIDLETQSRRWHPTKSESNLLDAYNFPDKDNMRQMADFFEELNVAVERISNHNEGCEICGKLRGN